MSKLFNKTLSFTRDSLYWQPNSLASAATNSSKSFLSKQPQTSKISQLKPSKQTILKPNESKKQGFKYAKVNEDKILNAAEAESSMQCSTNVTQALGKSGSNDKKLQISSPSCLINNQQKTRQNIHKEQVSQAQDCFTSNTTKRNENIIDVPDSPCFDQIVPGDLLSPPSASHVDDFEVKDQTKSKEHTGKFEEKEFVLKRQKLNQSQYGSLQTINSKVMMQQGFESSKLNNSGEIDGEKSFTLVDESLFDDNNDNTQATKYERTISSQKQAGQQNLLDSSNQETKICDGKQTNLEKRIVQNAKANSLNKTKKIQPQNENTPQNAILQNVETNDFITQENIQRQKDETIHKKGNDQEFHRSKISFLNNDQSVPTGHDGILLKGEQTNGK